MRFAANGLALTAAFAALTAAAIGQQHEHGHGNLQPVSETSFAMGARISMQCVACHGPSGATDNPTFPILAGQHASYLAKQLHHFRAGERYNPMMTPVAQQLNDEEINAVALYFSAQSSMALGAEGDRDSAGSEGQYQ